MDIKTNTVNDIYLVSLRGEIDADAAPAIEHTLTQLTRAGCRILIDLAEVPYMSSAGLRTLLSLYRHINDQGGHVALSGLSERLRDIMAITGFLNFFTIHPDVDSGIRALQQHHETH